MNQFALQKSFIDDNTDVINAAVIVVGAILLSRLVDWLLVRNARRVARVRDRLPGGEALELSKAALTRLRLVRRLIAVTIIGVGIAIALNQVDALRPLSTTLLASSAVVGIAVGLAARGTLANGIAGMMLATVQPFRIGDVIEWEGSRGRVEDITLTYTFVRLPSGHRLVVPNERIAASSLENFTIGGIAVESDVSVFVAPRDAIRGLGLLRDEFPDRDVVIAGVEIDRAELKVNFKVSAQDEAAERSRTRELAVGMLDSAGMLGPAPGDGAGGPAS